MSLAISPALRDALERWLAHLAALNDASDHTVAAYRGDVAQFLDFLARHHGGAAGMAQLRAVDSRDLRAWMAQARASGRGARSLARALSALKGFVRWLAEREDDFDPTAILSAQAPKHQRPLPRPLDEDAALEAIGFLAGIFPRSPLRVTVHRGGAAASKSLAGRAVDRFGLTPDRVTAGKLAPKPGTIVSIEVLSVP